MKNRKLRFLPPAALCAVLLFSCRPVVNLQRPEDYLAIKTLSFPDDFESFWNGMNNNYLFWDIDPTDWDAVYRAYKPRFAALGAFAWEETGGTDFKAACNLAYRYYEEMTANLVDGHYRLSFYDYGLRFLSIIPANTRISKRFAPGINEFEVQDSDWSGTNPSDVSTYDYMENVIFKYLDNAAQKEILADHELKLATGEITASGGGKILYFYFSGFSLVEAETVSTVIPRVINTLKTADLKGVIIDVRWNGGGNVQDLGFLWGRMTETDLTPLYTRTKSGEGRLDYTPWIPFRIIAAPRTERMKSRGVPIVLLTNKLSVSCAELSAMGVKLLPNGTVIGETTYGATSPLSDNRKYNGGTFNGEHFWGEVYTPLAMVKGHDGAVYEGVGVSPDIDAPLDWSRFLAANSADRGDSQLEAAIRHIDPNHAF